MKIKNAGVRRGKKYEARVKEMGKGREKITGKNRLRLVQKISEYEEQFYYLVSLLDRGQSILLYCVLSILSTKQFSLPSRVL